MQGQTVLVTGATSGIGRVTARELAKRGARVVITTRDEAKGRATLEEIRKAAPGAQLDVLRGDLSIMREVRRLAAEFKQRYDRLDVLVNNAGAIYMKRETTAEGLERTFATNHLAYFVLTMELLDLLKKSAPARIVNVASNAHTRGRMYWDDLQLERRYGGWKAYQQSKLANLLFTRELALRLEGSRVTVNSLHPGVVGTGFGLNSKGPFKLLWKTANHFFLTPEQGAETTIYLASSPEVQGRTGGYYKNCKEAKASRLGRDDEAARRLWQETERILSGLQ